MVQQGSLPEPSYLREIAAQLRSRAGSDAPAALREQLLALAEYYDDMAATVTPPLLAAAAPR
jgi:hypothetical protein